MSIEQSFRASVTNFISINFDHYRNHNPDLQGLSDQSLVTHYGSHGYLEGRIASKLCTREAVLKVMQQRRVLEIGPFCSPMLKGDLVKYFDVLDKSQLIERAKELNLPISNIPVIDYVDKQGDLSAVSEKFEAIVSSHNIEHQPDLISHLIDIAGLLDQGGEYVLIIPHCKFCFDAKLPVSKISEIFNAYYDKRKRHSIGSIIEHRAMTTHNDQKVHWSENSNARQHVDLIATHFLDLDDDKIKRAIAEYEDEGDTYIDVHAWQFTPISFSTILNCLIKLKLIPFSKVEVFGPVKNRNEFVSIITK